MKYIVLDTNIFHAAFNDSTSDAMSVLHKIKTDIKLGICLDNEYEIIDEYFGQSCSELIQRWILRTFGNIPNKIYYCSSNLDDCVEFELKRLNFEPADLPFVGTAYNSDKIIVTEDSDYGVGSNLKAQTPIKQSVLQYLQSIGMTIYDYNSAMLSL